MLAYLPVVAFYYRGRLMLKFKLSTTYEELRKTISNMTGKENIFNLQFTLE